MIRRRAVRIGFIAGAAVVAALLAGLLGTQVSAQDEAISIGSATVATEGQASVDLEALNMPDPGLGAWSLDITYDPLVVTAANCSAQNGSYCNPAYADDTVRVTGADPGGLEGDTTLAIITFACGESEGVSSLTLSLDVVADATPGDPQDIVTDTENGSITCADQTADQGETISIGSGTAAPDDQVEVDLEALDMPAPGLGAWTVDITYDPTVLTADACSPRTGGVCNTDFDDDTVRVTGANADGLEGDSTLAAITFGCKSEGASNLTLAVQVLVDATVGAPAVIVADTEDGKITCAEAEATPTATPGLTATPTPTPGGEGLPKAGTGIGGGWDGGSPLSWLIAGLIGAGIAWLIAGVAGAGLATVGGPGALRMRPTVGPPEPTTARSSGAASLPKAGDRPAGSDGGSARSWFAAARKELASTGLAGITGFRRRGRRS